MGKTLIVAEKPSVGRDIADALDGTFKKHDTFLESDEYVVTWAVGHLVELAEPEDYDPKFKRWRRADLPIIPEEFRLRPREDSKKQLVSIHRLVSRDDVDAVINACDAGREGELIFAYTIETAPVSKPVRRLWISSMTKKAIREGFAQLRSGEDLKDLEASARCRSEADWLVGMNATRAATVQARSAFGGVVSLGRVQTPTLGILAAREKEIQEFIPETYHLVNAEFSANGSATGGAGQPRTYAGVWFDPEKPAADAQSTWIRDAARAAAVADAVRDKQGIVEQLDVKKQTERPALLYDLTSLQRDANRRFGFSARRTLQAAQGLYEAHKVLTYPRTNSRYLTSDMIEELKPRAEMLGRHEVYRTASQFVVALDKLPLERIVNDEKVDDHHAIIPTEQLADMSKLRDDEKRVYDLVVRRYLAAFHPIARFELTTVVTLVENERFRTRGRVLVEPGWKAVYGLTADVPEEGQNDDEREQRLPKLEQNEQVHCQRADAEEKQTRPPARYTEGTLLSAMETAGKLVDDEQLREAMKERGLGTPATRAQIIDLLVNRQYIQREGKNLRVTPKGMKLIDILQQHPLTSPEMTGEWEKKLRDIEHGQLKRDEFMGGIVSFTSDTVEKILAIDREKLRMQRAELGPCPRCAAAGREEIIRENSKAYGCTSWKSREETGCGFVIWRTIAGRQLMPDEAKELIENRITSQELAGFKSKNRKSFRAKLRLNEEDKVEFVFAQPRPGAARKKSDDGEPHTEDFQESTISPASDPAVAETDQPAAAGEPAPAGGTATVA